MSHTRPKAPSMEGLSVINEHITSIIMQEGSKFVPDHRPCPALSVGPSHRSKLHTSVHSCRPYLAFTRRMGLVLSL